MARCGRCGLFAKYPDDHHEQKWSGQCVWYQLQLAEDEVFEERDCKDFFEKVPGVHVMDLMNYKVKRDDLSRIHKETQYNRIGLIISAVGAAIGICLSIVGLVYG